MASFIFCFNFAWESRFTILEYPFYRDTEPKCSDDLASLCQQVRRLQRMKRDGPVQPIPSRWQCNLIHSPFSESKVIGDNYLHIKSRWQSRFAFHIPRPHKKWTVFNRKPAKQSAFRIFINTTLMPPCRTPLVCFAATVKNLDYPSGDCARQYGMRRYFYENKNIMTYIIYILINGESILSNNIEMGA